MWKAVEAKAEKTEIAKVKEMLEMIHTYQMDLYARVVDNELGFYFILFLF